MFQRSGMAVSATFIPTKTARALLELSDHPIVAQAGRDAFEARQAERRRLADEAERIRAEGDAELDRLRDEIDAAAKDLSQARAAIAAAVQRETNARSALTARSLLISSAVEKRRNLIVAQCEPVIADARRKLLDLYATREDVGASELTSRHPVTGAKCITVTSKARSLADRRAAIRAGLAALDAMSREPDQADVAPRIERIFAELPAARFETEVYESPALPPSKRRPDVVDGAVIAFGGSN